MSKQHPVSKEIRKKRVDLLIRLSLLLIITFVIFVFAVKPMLIDKDFYFEAGKNVIFNKLGVDNGENSYDVAVIGDGLDGIAAAVGSSRVGAKTLLILSSAELGDELHKTFNVSWLPDISPTGDNVSSDLFKEIAYNAGEAFNIDNYIQALNKMAGGEEKLTIMTQTRLVDVSYKNGKVSDLLVENGGSKKKIEAERYIDATKNGDLLQKCNAEYTLGYSETGIDGLYPPVSLNFMISGVDYNQLLEMMKTKGTMLSNLLRSYYTSDNDITIGGFNITDQGNSRVIIEAVNMGNVNLEDEKLLAAAYSKAVSECNNLYNYLKLNIPEFKNASGFTVAEEFHKPSPYHFKGRYSLSLTDVLTGKRFDDRVSTAARPVTLTLKDGSRYILCNPKIFYIPLRSLIPQGFDNVLMSGDKISCSPLVQPAISSNSSIVGTGYAAGITAAYSISKNMEMPLIADDHNLDVQLELETTLRKLGVYMSDKQEEISGLMNDWSYPYIVKLNNLGLLSAGVTNDFRLGKEAESQDLAYILLNGVARSSKDAYNYQFDATLRKYLKEEPLTKGLFARMLLELEGQKPDGDSYSEACKQGLIDQTLQERLRNKEVLGYREIYYASVQFIENRTGKTLK